jgi:hypothetical protein
VPAYGTPACASGHRRSLACTQPNVDLVSYGARSPARRVPAGSLQARLQHPLPAVTARLSVRRWILPGMASSKDQDLTDAEFRECDLTRARLIGVVMQDAVIDGLVTNLVVNGVDVTSYVEAELDRRYPVRLLLRSADPADLLQAVRQLRPAGRRRSSGCERCPGVRSSSASAANSRR